MTKNTLTKSQREALSIGKYEPRKRAANEALPITFTQSSINKMPSMEPVRPGANDHLKIGRVGFFC